MKIIDEIKDRLSFNDNNKRWMKFYPKDKRKIDYPNMSLYEFLKKNNIGNMDNIAINYFGNKITYRDFFSEIDNCAKALRTNGIRPGDVVSICMANTPEAVVSLYAVSKIGAIANLIHPLSAEEEIRYSLNETKSVLLITMNITYSKVKHVVEETNVYKTVIVSAKDSMPGIMGLGYYILEDRKTKIPKSSEKFIYWKDFIEQGKDYDTQVIVNTTKDQPAVIMHSGGTSGTPKHILLSNGNINVVVGQAKISLPEVDRTDSMLSILPLFHAFGLVECIHYPLCVGATVILVPKFDAGRFDKLLTKYKPTIIPGVPTLFEALISNKHMDKVDFSKVKYIVSGGDTLTPERNKAVNEFLKAHNCKHNIVQGYGLTEASGGVIFAALGSDVLGSVGIPLVGNDLKIIDPNTHKELKPNETGEILVSGPSVMLGYLNNEKETNDILEKDKKGNIWVHTGDLGYINEDGVLFFVQRLKRLIIVSGYNVFPSHLEDVINKNEYVLNCCVVGIPHPYKVQVPKAYIVLKDGVKVNSKIKREIKEYCEKNLAKYMIPKEFEFRESLPKTLIGKVDYRKLEEENK